jgi:hypothetical protein
MAFSDKLQEMLNQGMELSKDFLDKAGAKAKELGELGVMKWEIIQLRGQMKKVAAQLGAAVYSTLMEEGQKSLSADSPAIQDSLVKLDQLMKDVNEREAEYRKKGGKSEDLDKPIA